MRGFAAALAALAAVPAVAGTSLVDPAVPGPDTPPAGRSVFSELFEAGVPFPFNALLDELRTAAGAGNVQTALIPLGRSLQRFSAAPDFFASPRLIVAVTGDRAAGPDAPRLAGRLFVGYQPASGTIEVLSYNDEAGRFEFQQILGYTAGRPRAVEPASRATCTACHQGHGPIFARPLWSETSANPAVAARLAGLGATFHGAPVRQNIDAVEAFDAATDRAARIALANRLWGEGCADPPCRAVLLSAALGYGLNGARPGWRATAGAVAAAFSSRAAALWPDGLSTPGFDLPNRDPIPLLATRAPDAIVETEGAMNPETRREPVTLWQPTADAFDAAAREIAALLTPGDLALIDRLLRKAAPESSVTDELACETATAPRPSGGEELRFTCTGSGHALSGHLAQGAAGTAGRIDTLRIAGAPPLSNLHATVVESAETMTVFLAQPGSGIAARLADGRRIAQLEIAVQERRARIHIFDDFSPLAAALDRQARAGDPAFGPGPFRRRAVLRALLGILDDTNG